MSSSLNSSRKPNTIVRDQRTSGDLRWTWKKKTCLTTRTISQTENQTEKCEFGNQILKFKSSYVQDKTVKLRKKNTVQNGHKMVYVYINLKVQSDTHTNKNKFV